MTSPDLQHQQKESWGSKAGVILAVAGSAVGLGNFLRFPGTAVNNGGGAFMVPYIISFLLLGIPIVWCEWTMGRLGGRYGQNNGAGILYAIWRKAPAKGIGALTLLVPIVVYMYYVLLEALCLRYSVAYFTGGFDAHIGAAVEGIAKNTAAYNDAVAGASVEYAMDQFALKSNGAMFESSMLWYVCVCFLVNFVIIYRGVTRGIETFCKFAMPLLIGCAIIVLVRVLTLDNIGTGLGFMWNPKWELLKNPEVWMRAAGQIFFSLSVGFGLILCYSSYLKPSDDVVLTSLSASSANEFCEVILGGLIVVPAAFLFLGSSHTPESTFQVGFFTVPAIMHLMPFGGNFFGGMWFGLLFLAAVTSSLSMLQPAIAFLEDGFGLRRPVSVTLLAIITAAGASLVMYFSLNAQALDFTDFACEFMMIVAGLAQVLIFGWVIGAERGVNETNRGSDFKLPSFMPFMIRYLTPAFLIIVLSLWCYYNAPDRLRSMSPEYKGIEAALVAEFPDEFTGEDGAKKKIERVREIQSKPRATKPTWYTQPTEAVKAKIADARLNANIARFSIVGVGLLFIIITAAIDIACRNRIGQTIAHREHLESLMEA
ncbi:MAG TPA: sodium-dependent transporter [Phycisphaerae bacterium]|nr:sodium-dependent transporter [Phycisphaerae bacterium]